MKIFFLAILFFYFCNTFVSAQKIEMGSWNILNLKYSTSEKLSFFGEAQLRSLKFYNDFHYYEFKGGFNYKIHKSSKLTLAAGSYQTYKEGGDFVLPKNNNEFRVWPQIVMLQSLGKIKVEQRYRMEMRFTNNGYRNRFRYRLGLSYLFGKEIKDFKPFQISASNEIFFTDKQPYFERNRLLFAFNYKPTKATSLQIGYLHQFDYKINDETGRDFFQIGYFIELSRKSSNNSTVDTDSKDN